VVSSSSQYPTRYCTCINYSPLATCHSPLFCTFTTNTNAYDHYAGRLYRFPIYFSRFRLMVIISTGKKNHPKQIQRFLLAEGALNWWAIGASLIASTFLLNILLECPIRFCTWAPFLLMNGWPRNIDIVAFIIPVYLKNKIYTMHSIFGHDGIINVVSTIMQFSGCSCSILKSDHRSFTSVHRN